MVRSPDGETDITTVFGTVGPGSIPGRGTVFKKLFTLEVFPTRKPNYR